MGEEQYLEKSVTRLHMNREMYEELVANPKKGLKLIVNPVKENHPKGVYRFSNRVARFIYNDSGNKVCDSDFIYDFVPSTLWRFFTEDKQNSTKTPYKSMTWVEEWDLNCLVRTPKTESSLQKNLRIMANFAGKVSFYLVIISGLMGLIYWFTDVEIIADIAGWIFLGVFVFWLIFGGIWDTLYEENGAWSIQNYH